MKATLYNLYLWVINSLKLLKYRIWGHNRVGNTGMTEEELRKYLQENYLCKVCGMPLPKARGQIMRYHHECRKWRHNPAEFRRQQIKI